MRDRPAEGGEAKLEDGREDFTGAALRATAPGSDFSLNLAPPP